MFLMVWQTRRMEHDENGTHKNLQNVCQVLHPWHPSSSRWLMWIMLTSWPSKRSTRRADWNLVKDAPISLCHVSKTKKGESLEGPGQYIVYYMCISNTVCIYIFFFCCMHIFNIFVILCHMSRMRYTCYEFILYICRFRFTCWLDRSCMRWQMVNGKVAKLQKTFPRIQDVHIIAFPCQRPQWNCDGQKHTRHMEMMKSYMESTHI